MNQGGIQGEREGLEDWHGSSGSEKQRNAEYYRGHEDGLEVKRGLIDQVAG